MREKVFENKVKAFLKSRNHWHLKTWSNGIQRSGIPDILCCINGLFVGVELKNETGKPSCLQIWNRDEIRNSNGISIVLYPCDFEKFKDFILDIETYGNNFNSRKQYEFDGSIK